MIRVVKVGSPRTRCIERIPVHRPHALGNPFLMRHEDERASVIRQYKDWFDAHLYDVKMQQAIRDIIELMLADGEVELSCFCAPKPCHADVIKQFIEDHYPALFGGDI